MNHTLTQQRVQRICTDGVLIALYFVLTTFSLRMGNLRITFASLIVIVATLLFSTLDACLIAMLGELLTQVLQYGMTVTTPMWLLPPAIRALVLGLFFYVARKFGIFSPRANRYSCTPHVSQLRYVPHLPIPLPHTLTANCFTIIPLHMYSAICFCGSVPVY